MRISSKLVVNIFVGVLFVIGILTFYNTFSFDNEYVFDSLVYDINNGYINGVSSNTSVGLYYKYFDMLNKESLKEVDDRMVIINNFLDNVEGK